MLFASCSNETIIESVAPEVKEQGGMKEVTLLTSAPTECLPHSVGVWGENTENDIFSTSKSRHTLDPTGDGLKHRWEYGDTISLIYNMDNSGSKTKWQAVNLVYVETIENNHKFIGKVPENYDGTFRAIYPALDSHNGEPSYGVVYTHEADGKYTDSADKSAIHKYFDSLLGKHNQVQVQVGNNNTRHLVKNDFLLVDKEIRWQKKGDLIDLTKGGLDLVWKHTNVFLKFLLSPKYMLKGTLPIGIGIQGFWGNEDNDPQVKKEYNVAIQDPNNDFENTNDIIIYMLVPTGHVKAGKEVHLIYYTINSQQWFKKVAPDDSQLKCGVEETGDFPIYNFNFRDIKPEETKGMFYAWGTLDGYDVRVDNWSTNYSKGFKNCSHAEIENYLPGYKNGWNGETNCWAGIYNANPMNISPDGTDTHNLKTYEQPIGVGDPATYWSKGKLHVPSSIEMNALLCLQGDIQWNKNNTPTPVTKLPSFKDQSGLQQLAQCVSKELETHPIFRNKNGHKTGFWVAIDKNGEPRLNWSCDEDAKNDGMERIYGWRIYSSNSYNLSDPYVLLPMHGTPFNNPNEASKNQWNYNETCFWTSSSATGADAKGEALTFKNGAIADWHDGVGVKDANGAYLVFGITDIKDYLCPNVYRPTEK